MTKSKTTTASKTKAKTSSNGKAEVSHELMSETLSKTIIKMLKVDGAQLEQWVGDVTPADIQRTKWMPGIMAEEIIMRSVGVELVTRREARCEDVDLAYTAKNPPRLTALFSEKTLPSLLGDSVMGAVLPPLVAIELPNGKLGLLDGVTRLLYLALGRVGWFRVIIVKAETDLYLRCLRDKLNTHGDGNGLEDMRMKAFACCVAEKLTVSEKINTVASLYKMTRPSTLVDWVHCNIAATFLSETSGKHIPFCPNVVSKPPFTQEVLRKIYDIGNGDERQPVAAALVEVAEKYQPKAEDLVKLLTQCLSGSHGPVSTTRMLDFIAGFATKAESDAKDRDANKISFVEAVRAEQAKKSGKQTSSMPAEKKPDSSAIKSAVSAMFSAIEPVITNSESNLYVHLRGNPGAADKALADLVSLNGKLTKILKASQ